LGNSNLNFDFEDIYKMILDLNDCLCNININVDPYILIEICLLKYVRSDTNYNPGNNLIVNSSEVVPKIEKKEEPKIEVDTKEAKEEVINMQSEEANKTEMGNKEDESESKEEINEDLGNKPITINIDVRINNTFVDVSKDCKNELTSSWVDFMNYLMNKDRNLLNRLSDTSILAASPTYALIQSKVESTNDLINSSIDELEKYYKDFSGKLLKFAALNNDIWDKEKEKYRINLKKNIKYSYIDEGLSEEVTKDENPKEELDDIESLAKDIFDSYEVE
jgi:hypothetical protein